MIYFDNSATTKAAPEAVDTYAKVSANYWGNPSSLHNFGEQAFNLLEQSRQQIADLVGVKLSEILFTSGGTEGDNWAIKGTAMAKREFGKHLITTAVEHPAVHNSMEQLKQLGYDVTYLPVDENGRVSADDLRAAIRPDTILVSTMAVNNEIGAVQPLAEIADVLRDFPKIHWHIDAVQGIGKGLHDLIFNDRVDFVTFSGHKFHAPRGIGFMYKRQGRKIAPLMAGGGQERNLRSGTENLPAIAAMAKALRLLLADEPAKVAQQRAIRLAILHHIETFDHVTVFSKDLPVFAPHILCFAIEGVRGETIVHAFEEHQIYISTTSACSSKKHVESSTLQAMQINPDVATSAVRISLDEHNTMAEAEEFNRVFDVLYQQFAKLR
ncbi:cysteine sulfinate desulfinase cysteine desulfurase [Levilactobacillus namurensis DSM 19117]|uniref:Cysteine sulfinate desulfinase cysteine desulfurase n=2 Tax=Levilactobacillus namurensis TaxID=380393 RepID=A0A0R1K0J3_9LACO|nr:cysteine desulfurase family protein [Levilactobacillus namurensis]PTM23334.1 cysteine desulfurase [Lactobacillus sp. PFC-70]KRK76700.1 cysteine sulfinate desulfinase cysteine desulfurase [Levilactobacillus namurensis DSM 19117]MCW3777878.1 cysteine desulfurase [Levilactobacillus namurensis]MDT7014108.1 cysteine desulfurase family protein [Levilactobacillus namurensis]MDT7018960.1 cysteine desulfurase family protein [Levilactobacillus namurensis]